MNIRTLVAPLVAGVCGLALITLTPRLTAQQPPAPQAQPQGAGVRTSGRVGAFVSTARGGDHHGDGEEDRCMDDRHDL